MAYDIIIGRDEKDLKELENKGLIFLGKTYVKMGQFTSMSNKIFMDVTKSHVVLISGKRGSGKSYGLGVIAEEMAHLPEEVKNNIAVLMIDTMGIFWTMKFPNNQQIDILEDWNLKPKGMDIKVYTPMGKYNLYKEKNIPTDFSFSIKPSELSASDWCNVFDIKITD